MEAKEGEEAKEPEEAKEAVEVTEAKALEDISPDTPLNKKKRVSKASTPLACAALYNVANLFV